MRAKTPLVNPLFGSSALVVFLALSAPAWADGTAVFQLKTDFIPVADFALVRVTMQSIDPAQTVFITEHVADPGKDYAAGVRVAEFDPVPYDEYRASIEIVDGQGFTIAERPVRIEIDHDGVLVVTLLIVSGSPPPDVHDHLTHWTSEERLPALCKPHAAAVGIECNGDFCDNVRLTCSPVPGGLGTERWTPFFSEEQPGLQGCAIDEFVTGLECAGSWCDEVSLRCAEIPGTIRSCELSGVVSDETGPHRAPDGAFLTRMACGGSYCDDKTIEACSLWEELWAMRLFFDLCVSIEGMPSGKIEPGLELGVAPCRDSETGNLDQRWVIGSDGTIYSPDTQLCPVAGTNGFVVDFCTGNDLKWAPDFEHRLRSVTDPSLCLTVDSPGEPWQWPEGWSGLLLEPCDDRADQMWVLPGMQSFLIFTDGFESGDTTRWSQTQP